MDQEQESIHRHREQVHAAERCRLRGEAVYMPEEVDERLEKVFRDHGE